MRTLLLAASLLLPSCAAAQLAPRSVALEAGWISGSSRSFPERLPIAIGATWWLTDGLDLAAHVSWAAVAETGVRAADAVAEVAVGLRQRIVRWPGVRLEGLVDVSGIRGVGGDAAGGSALRLAGGLAIEAFVLPDLSLAIAAERGVLIGAGGGSPLSASLRAAAYF